MAFTLAFWTQQEDSQLIQRMMDGERIADIARSFPGRSERSVLARAARLRGSDNRDFDRRKARNSSERLAEAINALIDRMPAREVADMLGKPHLAIPGTERIYKTASAERLAA